MFDNLSQLASSGLPSLGPSQDNPSWNRSLSELKIASDSLWTQSTPGVLADTSVKSSIGTRPLPELERIQISPETDSFQTKQSSEDAFLNWEEGIRKREIGILQSIVQKAESATLRKSKELHEKREQEDWEKKRDLWMRELVGTRNLGGSATDGYGAMGVPLLEDGSGAGLIQPAGRPLMVSNNTDSLDTSSAVDPRIVVSHLEIVKQQKGGGNNPDMAVQLADAVDSTTANSPQNTGYTTALRLMSRIRSRRNRNAIEVALATLSHFSGQFLDYMMGKLRQAGRQTNHPSYTSSNANTIADFVSMELGFTAEATPWPCIYFCKNLCRFFVSFLSIFSFFAFRLAYRRRCCCHGGI